MRSFRWAYSGFLIALAATYGFAGESRSVSYMVDGKQYEGYFFDAGKKSPFILLVHDWDGLGDYEMKRSRMLSKIGYSVFATDLFGAGIRPSKMEDRQKLTGELYSDRKKMRALLHGALEEARNHGADITNSVAIGYCFGGAAVLELARSGEQLKGFVAFHGGLETPAGQDYSGTKGTILVLHGSADKAVPINQFAALAQKLESGGIAHEMILYGGADHAFTVFGGERYNENADLKSWQRFISFLEETLEK
ncbi:MAG: dienelactone hydrolase family protein [Chitinispirillaceae bacterium]|nr:dienelactone hydrolase family protein [Chitinispirillaceae bacterium]